MRILSLGAGVQSSTLIYMEQEGLIKPFDYVIFADTQAEPQAVYKHLEYLQTIRPIEIVTEGSLFDEFYKSSKFRSGVPLYTKVENRVRILKRQCTSDFKIDPINRRIKQLAIENKLVRQTQRVRLPNKSIIINIGISVDESFRANHHPRERWRINEYPLLDLGYTREDCIKYTVKNGYKIPPKSSCIFCPFHDDDYWLSLSQEEWNEALKLDEYIRTSEFKAKTKLKGTFYLHRTCKPLKEVELSPKPKNKQLGLKLELIDSPSCKSTDSFSCFS